MDEAQVAAGQCQAAADTGFQERDRVGDRSAAEQQEGGRGEREPDRQERLRVDAAAHDPREWFRARAVEDPGECQRTGAHHAPPGRRVRHRPVSCRWCGRADIAAACGLHRPFPSDRRAAWCKRRGKSRTSRRTTTDPNRYLCTDDCGRVPDSSRRRRALPAGQPTSHERNGDHSELLPASSELPAAPADARRAEPVADRRRNRGRDRLSRCALIRRRIHLFRQWLFRQGYSDESGNSQFYGDGENSIVTTDDGELIYSDDNGNSFSVGG